MSGDGLEQLLRLDRLGDVAIHADFEAALAIPLHGMGSHGNNGDVPSGSPLASTDRQRGLEAVHLGHLHVHQHQIERLPIEGRHRLLAAACNHDRVSVLFESSHYQPLIDGVVLGEKNVQRTGGSGRRRRLGRLGREWRRLTNVSGR